MSGLAIRLPLISNVIDTNQGYMNPLFENTNITENVKGKIGKCCYFNGTDSRILMKNVDFVTLLKNDFTISFWVNDIRPGERTCYFSTYNLTSGVSSGISIEKLANNRLRIYWVGSPDYQSTLVVPDSTWTHLLIIHKNSNIYIYMNGEYQTERSDGTFTASKLGAYTNGAIGRDYRTTTPALMGYMNDFRIYDYALSSDEIEEAYNSLIIHLPLCPPGNNNILDNSNWQIASTSYNIARYPLNSAPNAGDEVTVQLKGELGEDKTTFLLYNSGGYIRLKNFDKQSFNDAGIYTGTFNWVITNGSSTANNTQLYVYAYPSSGTSESTIEWIKLEYGDKATVWCPSSTDSKYDDMGYSDLIEYDSSGNKYNATINNVSWSDGPHNMGSYSFNGTDSYIKIESTDWMVQGAEELTINFWAYHTNWPSATVAHMFSCTESGGFNVENAGSGYLRFSIHVYTNEEQTSTAYKYSNTAIKLADISSGWHMFTFIYSSINGYSKVYIDGIQISLFEYESFGLHFNKSTRLFVGCEASTQANPTAPYFNGKICDFRMYCVELKDNFIKKLYGDKNE